MNNSVVFSNLAEIPNRNFVANEINDFVNNQRVNLRNSTNYNVALQDS
jgi:hypothetical protein